MSSPSSLSTHLWAYSPCSSSLPLSISLYVVLSPLRPSPEGTSSRFLTLLILRPQLFQNCQTPPRIDTKRHRLALGRRPTKSLQRIKNTNVHQPSAHPTRL